MTARPEGVVVVKADGREIPCELTYRGVSDGIHEWEIATEFNPRAGDQLRVAVLPPRTGIVMPTRDFQGQRS